MTCRRTARASLLAAVVLAVPLALAACRVAMAQAETERSEDRRQATVGNAFEIVLQANPSTGYDWAIDTGTSDGLAQIAIEDLGLGSGSGEGQRPLVGAPRTRSWRMTPTAPGLVRIVLAYRRPWEAAAPARIHTLHVEIRP